MTVSRSLAPLCCAILLVLSWAAPSRVYAADKAGVAMTMAQQAAKAFQAGDYDRAAEMYLNAFRASNEADYLFGAARSYHVGGHDDRAAELYRKFMETAGADAGRVQKAKEYLGAIDDKRALGLISDAETAARSEDYRLAASLYLSAWRLASGRSELLLKAAVAEDKAGQAAEAKEHLEQYLALAPMDAGDRPQAQARLEAIRRKLAPAQTSPKIEPSKHEAPKAEPKKSIVLQDPQLPMVTAPQPEATPSRWMPWTLTGGGVALMATGVGVLLGAQSDLAQYQRDTAKGSDGFVRGLTYAQAQSRASSINTRVGAAAAVGAVGVAAAGVGTWLLLKTPAHIAVGPSSIDVTVRF